MIILKFCFNKMLGIMKDWRVTSYFVPEGSIRLRVHSETNVAKLSNLLVGNILWFGRPHMPFLRWGGLIFIPLGLLQVVFGLFVMRLPLCDIWPMELFGVLMMGVPLYNSLELMVTDYVITDEKIFVIHRLFRSVEEYDIARFSVRTDVFGNFGSRRQIPRTYDVQFLKCADGSMGRTSSNWKCFMSVTKADVYVIANVLRFLVK